MMIPSSKRTVIAIETMAIEIIDLAIINWWFCYVKGIQYIGNYRNWDIVGIPINRPFSTFVIEKKREPFISGILLYFCIVFTLVYFLCVFLLLCFFCLSTFMFLCFVLYFLCVFQFLCFSCWFHVFGSWCFQILPFVCFSSLLSVLSCLLFVCFLVLDFLHVQLQPQQERQDSKDKVKRTTRTTGAAGETKAVTTTTTTTKTKNGQNHKEVVSKMLRIAFKKEDAPNRHEAGWVLAFSAGGNASWVNPFWSPCSVPVIRWPWL